MVKVEARWKKEGMQFDAIAPGGEFSIDAAEDFGGQNKGNRPKALMLTSLAGCTGIDLLSLLRKMRQEVEDIWIEVEAELTEEHPKIYHKTHIIYNFKGDLDKDKVEKAVNLSYNTYCGVIEMFKSFSDVTFEIKYH